MSISPKNIASSPPSTSTSSSLASSPTAANERKGIYSTSPRTRSFVPQRIADKVDTSPRRTSVSSTRMSEASFSARSSPIISGSPPISNHKNQIMSTVYTDRVSLRNHEPMILAGTASSATTTITRPSHDPRSYLDKVTKLVKTRSGSVLSRNTILKMDHFPSGTNTKLDFHLQGAPNFRVAELGVYGVAQPTVVGLSTILALLNCHPESKYEASCTWFSTREEPLVYINGCPYVLRDYADPLQNMFAFRGMNSTRLEKVEERLKRDVVDEKNKDGGLLLVHQELPDGTIVPCYIAADEVQTPQEVFMAFRNKGYRTNYYRIPITLDQSPEDNYFDEYVRVIKTLKPTDPLIFNCGMGAVRTTVGIIIAQIIRRVQLLKLGQPDPFPVPGYEILVNAENEESDVISSVFSPDLARGLEEANNVTNQNRALLRVVDLLERAPVKKSASGSLIEWVLNCGKLIESLKEAIMGNYRCIISLASVLDDGTYCKKLLDQVIDGSDVIINLRDDILLNRIRHSTQSNMDDVYLSKALSGLQRYFFLLCFTAYITETPREENFEKRFSSWVKERSEVWSMLEHMRRKGPQLYQFRPVDDLRELTGGTSTSGTVSVHKLRRGWSGSAQSMFEMIGAGAQSGEVAGEVEDFILKARAGAVLTSQTILKVDFWPIGHLINGDQDETSRTPSSLIANPFSSDTSSNHHQKHHTFIIDGASHFRRVDSTHIYGVAQPTAVGISEVFHQLLQDRPKNKKILWINLREEPIIYINGIPYVLRDRHFSLRNLRTYKGITSDRLEQLEKRLQEDIIREIKMEINTNEGKILLHGENSEGKIERRWIEVDPADVLTVQEVMRVEEERVYQELNEGVPIEYPLDDDIHTKKFLDYHRVPITAERPPQCNDFDDLRKYITGEGIDLSNTAIIMNCQVGSGRSALGTVIATLLTRWLRVSDDNKTPSLIPTPSSSSLGHPNNDTPVSISSGSNASSIKSGNVERLNYQIINSLLRVIKNGIENKNIVDDAIDICGDPTNLRTVIEQTHIAMDNAEDETQRRKILKRGIVWLERYFFLICFQAYLDDTRPSIVDETESFEAWMKRHPEIKTIHHELRKEDKSLITPVGELSLGDGVALTSEIVDTVNKRHGQVLAKHTILKHDAFPGCQKASLPEKVGDAYNFRRVEVRMIKNAVKEGSPASLIKSGLNADLERAEEDDPSAPFICGCAMPSKEAIKAVLNHLNAGPGGKRRILWTCLREEPVLYVKNKPYVLRLYNEPIKNLETTGIARERVEDMEKRMQLDAREELCEKGGRLLLHDETDERGAIDLVAKFYTVNKEQVETPSEVFQSIVDEGYRVDYLRIPITDEQAPIPDVFDQLIRRVQDANAGVDVLFNCQMGRGRTTTGMVTASLMSMVLKNGPIMDLISSREIMDSPPLSETMADPNNNTTSSGATHYNDESYEERERYQNGEYKIVLQLVSVLTYGKRAKKLTDRAINMCDHMQNLRTAVYDFKLRLEAIEDRSSKKYKETRLVAQNYLVRYFYLIVFANYLLEEMGTLSLSSSSCQEETIVDDEARKITTFKEWLKGRREISNIIHLQSFDLS
ncbi:inositol hexakisphosphate-domain-containing protein [Phascolomyces articulosus]|uniref:Inositol hexakisphosphate-domain-containing protein n=1 Tax=Phascolomyces articulosus TaxID=60185 RepID=A0AAD5K3D0_9FUNG|nr:inositol hexakisphosphate-domain-containing protein [Phascolomyces articulosus]